MSSAFAWIGQLIEWFGALIPRLLVVEVGQQVVKLRRGHEIELLDPGLHVYWPFITRIRTATTARDTLDFSSQTLTLKCGKVVLVSGMIAFYVRDVVKLHVYTTDAILTLRDIGMTSILHVLTQYNWDEVREGIVNETIFKALRRKMQEDLGEYGVKVVEVGLKDLAPARVLKISQDVNQDVA